MSTDNRTMDLTQYEGASHLEIDGAPRVSGLRIWRGEQGTIYVVGASEDDWPSIRHAALGLDLRAPTNVNFRLAQAAAEVEHGVSVYASVEDLIESMPALRAEEVPE